MEEAQMQRDDEERRERERDWRVVCALDSLKPLWATNPTAHVGLNGPTMVAFFFFLLVFVCLMAAVPPLLCPCGGILLGGMQDVVVGGSCCFAG